MRSHTLSKLIAICLVLATLVSCNQSVEPEEWVPVYDTTYEPFVVTAHDFSLYMPFEGWINMGDPSMLESVPIVEGAEFYAYYGGHSRDDDWFWMVGYYNEMEDLVNIGQFDFTTSSEVIMYMMGKKLDMYLQRKVDSYPTNLVYDVKDHVSNGYATLTGTISVSTLDDSEQSDWPINGFAFLTDETAAVVVFVDKTGGDNSELLATYGEEALNTLEVDGQKLLK